MPGMSLRSAVLLALVLGGSAVPSLAASLKQEGAPQPASALSTYGMNVEVHRAINGLLPDGWELVMGPGAELSGTVSWGPKDTWIKALENAASKAKSDITLNWDTKQVLISGPVLAVNTTPAAKPQMAELSKPAGPAPTEAKLSEDRPVTSAVTLQTEKPQTASVAASAGSKPSAEMPAVSAVSSVPVAAPLITSVGKAPDLAVGARVASVPTAELKSSSTQEKPAALAAPVKTVAVPAPLKDVQNAGVPMTKVETPSAGPAKAFNRTALREPLEALAEAHELTLIYEAGTDVRLPGPVTLMLGPDLRADVELLNRALGRGLQLEVTEYLEEKELVVAPASSETSGSFVTKFSRPQIPEHRSLFARVFGGKKKQPQTETQSANTDTAQAASPGAEAPVLPAAPEVAPPPSPVPSPEVVLAKEPVKPAVPTPAATALPVEVPNEPVPPVAPVAQLVTLELAPGERLSVAIDRMLKAQNWTMVWRVSGDLEAGVAARVTGKTISEVLEQILPQHGLAADLYTPSRYAVIRNSQETASAGAQ